MRTFNTSVPARRGSLTQRCSIRWAIRLCNTRAPSCGRPRRGDKEPRVDLGRLFLRFEGLANCARNLDLGFINSLAELLGKGFPFPRPINSIRISLWEIGMGVSWFQITGTAHDCRLQPDSRRTSGENTWDSNSVQNNASGEPTRIHRFARSRLRRWDHPPTLFRRRTSF
jgi:hypothetical protein